MPQITAGHLSCSPGVQLRRLLNPGDEGHEETNLLKGGLTGNLLRRFWATHLCNYLADSLPFALIATSFGPRTHTDGKV